MTRYLILLFTYLNFISACSGQIRKAEVIEKKNSNYQYKDFVNDGEKLWGLTTDGKLSLFDANNGDPIPDKVRNDSVIIILAKDKEGNIVIGDKSKSIKRYEKHSNSWITLFKFDNTLLGLVFDSKNNYYLLTDKGIFDCLGKKYFYPDSSLNDQIQHGAGWFREPVFMTDTNDNIWIGFGYGEWGGELFIFSTIDKKFIIPQLKGFPITLNPIKSIFESNESVYVTSGLMHFSTSGSIAKFDDFHSSVIFESEAPKRANIETIDGEYIGPGAFNKADSCIYFYSQNGIFKGNPGKDLTRIENWIKVLQPKLHWSDGQPDAIGSPMNVLKLKFINDKLVFVSQNDGIGIYDGKTLIMIR